MKGTTMNLIVVAAILFCSTALAADETEDMTQPAETGMEAAVSAEPIMPTESASSSLDEAPEPARKRSDIKGYKQTTAFRPKDLDLRYCLELESNIEIARCAGE